MNLKNIKRNSALKFINNNNRKSENLVKNSFNGIEKVGIILPHDLKMTYDFTNKLCKELNIDQQDLTEIFFVDSLAKNEEGMFFSNKQLGFNAKLKGEAVARFLVKQYDLLVNYCNSDNLVAQVLAFKGKSKIKVGFNHETLNFYDLNIAIEENKIDTFNTEMIKYLRIMQVINE